MRTRRFYRPAIAAVVFAALLAACSDSPVEPRGGAELSASVTGLSFGVKEPGDPRVVRTFTVTNSGTARSEPLAIVVEGTGAEFFELDEPASTCVDLELSPGETCTVSLSFGGQGAGPLSASAFVDAGGDEPRIGVTLNGILQAILNIFIQGNGHGSVRAGQDGPSCDPVCSLTFIVPTVTLTAVPATGSRFVDWVGAPGCGTSVQCNLTLQDLNSVTVRFELQ